MAHLEFDDSVFDDIIEDLKHFEIDCPECKNHLRSLSMILESLCLVRIVEQKYRSNQNHNSFLSSEISFIKSLSSLSPYFIFLIFLIHFLQPVIFTLTDFVGTCLFCFLSILTPPPS